MKKGHQKKREGRSNGKDAQMLIPEKRGKKSCLRKLAGDAFSGLRQKYL